MGDTRVAAVIPQAGIQFFHTDHLGSTSDVTNSDGELLQHTEYTPYGEFSTSVLPKLGAVPAWTVPNFDGTDSEIITPYLFTGKLFDTSTDLYYYGARYYDPQLGRFITADTIVPDPANPQSFNRYGYANNNPIRYTDPTGHWWFSKLWNKIKDVVVSVVVTTLINVTGLMAAAATFGQAGYFGYYDHGSGDFEFVGWGGCGSAIWEFGRHDGNFHIMGMGVGSFVAGGSGSPAPSPAPQPSPSPVGSSSSLSSSSMPIGTSGGAVAVESVSVSPDMGIGQGAIQEKSIKAINSGQTQSVTDISQRTGGIESRSLSAKNIAQSVTKVKINWEQAQKESIESLINTAKSLIITSNKIFTDTPYIPWPEPTYSDLEFCLEALDIFSKVAKNPEGRTLAIWAKNTMEFVFDRPWYRERVSK